MVIEDINKLSNLVSTQFKIELNKEGVDFIDGFINRWRKSISDSEPDFEDKLVGMTNSLGSYLGEVMVREYNGKWEFDNENGWSVSVGSNKAYPFNKVRKHLKDGEGDSVLSFFKTFPIIIKN